VTLVIDDSDIITEPEKYPNYKLYINFENKASWGEINEK
jgi:hypothetical protein